MCMQFGIRTSPYPIRLAHNVPLAALFFGREVTHEIIFFDYNAAKAAGRVPQSLVSFMPEAVTQIQSSMLGPLTAFR